MTLLVLDTNAVTRGQFGLEALNRWLGVVGDQAEVIIPEVVIWEWAEHAASAYTTLGGQLREFRVGPELYERPVLGEPLAVTELVERIRRLLPRQVSVWSPPDSVWREAVKDQVLQVGSGERKEGVKTGAADSVVLACVKDQLENRQNAEPVLLATSDARLRANCTRLFGSDVLFANSTVALSEQINAFEPALDELQEKTDEDLRQLITDSHSDIGAALDTFEMGFRIHVGAESREEPTHQPPSHLLARMGRIEIVELHDLRVARAANQDRVGLADVRVFADILLTELQLRTSSAGTSEWVKAFDGPVSGGFVDLTVAISWDQNWNVTSVSPGTEAVIVFDSSEYDDLDNVPPFHAGPLDLPSAQHKLSATAG